MVSTLAGRRCAIFRLVIQPHLMQVPAVQIFELILCFASGQVSARPPVRECRTCATLCYYVQ